MSDALEEGESFLDVSKALVNCLWTVYLAAGALAAGLGWEESVAGESTAGSVTWRGWETGFKNGSGWTTLAGGAWAGVTFTVPNTGSWGFSKVLAINRASSLLNLSDHFLSRSEILASAEEVVDMLWSVVEEDGRWDDDFTDFSGLVDFEVEDDDFLLSVFFFFSAGPLKPKVWE